MFNIKVPILRPRLINNLSKCFSSTEICAGYRHHARPMIVTIIGAYGRVGKIVALMLKQNPHIDELRIFDYVPGICGIAMDLSHIDTTAPVKSYGDIHMLRYAVEDAKIVAICGGDAMKASHSEYELFRANADYVRNIALHTCEFNPKAIVCVATPPITAMVPLISEEYKKANVYDSRRILGVMSYGVMRANAILGQYTNTDPSQIKCPVIGGMGEKTTVPVISQTKIGATLSIPIAEVIRNKIANAENEALEAKFVENAGPCTIPIGLAIARFVGRLVRGVLDTYYGVDCAFVRQSGEVAHFLPYMGSVVKLGRYGVQSVHMPVLDNFEGAQLQRAYGTIREQIRWGEDYITGVSTKQKRRCKRQARPCQVIQLKNVNSMGDIAFDPSMEEVLRSGSLIPRNKH